MPSSEEFSQHDVKKLNTNNNNKNNIKNNNHLISSNLLNNIEYGSLYEQLFKENIEYGTLIQDKIDGPLIENITNIAVEALNSNQNSFYINSEPKDAEIVKSKLLKLNPSHIQYVINCLKQNRKDVRSLKSYILTTLYNSNDTIDIDTTLVVSKIMNS